MPNPITLVGIEFPTLLLTHIYAFEIQFGIGSMNN